MDHPHPPLGHHRRLRRSFHSLGWLHCGPVEPNWTYRIDKRTSTEPTRLNWSCRDWGSNSVSREPSVQGQGQPGLSLVDSRSTLMNRSRLDVTRQNGWWTAGSTLLLVIVGSHLPVTTINEYYYFWPSWTVVTDLPSPLFTNYAPSISHYCRLHTLISMDQLLPTSNHCPSIIVYQPLPLSMFIHLFVGSPSSTITSRYEPLSIMIYRYCWPLHAFYETTIRHFCSPLSIMIFPLLTMIFTRYHNSIIRNWPFGNGSYHDWSTSNY